MLFAKVMREFLWKYRIDCNLISIFSFFAAMLFRFKHYTLLVLLMSAALHARTQCLPETEDIFLNKLNYTNQLPEQILSGRSVLFYHHSLSSKELKQVQKSFAETGIDAICAIELEKLLAGQDVRQGIFSVLQKRELSNVLILRKNPQGYRLVITTFNGLASFVSNNQAAWQNNGASLSEMLLQLKREALASFKVQNLLINEQPETDLAFRPFSGSRIEGFTTDFRVDRLAVRLSSYAAENEKLKEVCGNYPFKIEFVEPTVSDAELRQKGFWYVLNCVHAREQEVRNLLGYAETKANTPAPTTEVYKFYLKKLEFDNVYLGKEWDAATTWEQSLGNFIANIRKDLKVQ